MGGFILGIVGIALALYAPGYLFFRALRFTRLHAVVAAPLFSAAVYGLLPILYFKVGIPCSVPTTFFVALAIGAAAFGITRRRAQALPVYGMPRARGSWKDASSPRESASDWGLFALYLVCGIVVVSAVFGSSLASPDAAYIRYDNQTHLNIAKAFLDSGQWSSLHANRYLAQAPESIPLTLGSGSFYPSLLYGLSALCSCIAGIGICAGYNATLFALMAIVFPIGMFGIIRVAFDGSRLAIAVGAIAAVSFTAFPWGVLMRGLFPNACGLCLMAPAIASTMVLLHPLASRDVHAIRTADDASPQGSAGATGYAGIIGRGVALWACALPALALGQPNAVFGAFIFLAAYTAHVVGELLARRYPGDARRSLFARIAGIAAVAGIALAIWLVCLNLPFLQSVVHYFGNSIQKPGRVLRRTLLLWVDPFRGQYLLSLCCAIGAIWCLYKRKLWILVPAFWMGLAYFIIRTQNTALTHFLAGFWYSDHVRIAAVYAIFLMPLAASGIAATVSALGLLAKRFMPARAQLCTLVIGIVVVLAFCIANFFPNVPTGADKVRKTGFGTVYTELHNMYCVKDNRVYGSDEQAFAEKARQITGEDLVLNYPTDGSAFCYPMNDLNVYYRSAKVKNGTAEAKAIRTKLADYARNAKVQAAVEAIGARYLLKLDHGVSFEDGKWFRQFKNPERWKGIEAVDDDTPGFAVVLSEGDMRLYRIEEL